MTGRRVWAILGCCVVLLTATGCGPSRPKTSPVAGTVTYKKQPLKGASVIFMPRSKGRPGMGQTDAAGHYSLKTFSPDDGAILGEHIVTITVAAPKAKPGVAPGKAAPPAFPDKYASSETSGLKATVPADQKEYNFNLE